MLFLKYRRQMSHDALVEVLAAQVGVARGGLHFEDAIFHAEQGHVEGTATQVEHENKPLRGRYGTCVGCAIGAFVHSRGRAGVDGAGEAIGDSGRSRLVDDAEHFEARDSPCILGGLPLAVAEIGGDSDDGLGHRSTQVALGGQLELSQDHR
mmetsp:Transcript_12037/g.30892  ORF Transcript_12037/g.30892 Transcript_12037/m.30892 type:complete len:152 (+) Transcript_12037:1308-1763(+)